MSDGCSVSDEVVSIMRQRCLAGLGVVCTFVDDDMNLLVGLAQRAVLAGLATDVHPSALRCMLEAAEKCRDDHEKAIGRKL